MQLKADEDLLSFDLKLVGPFQDLPQCENLVYRRSAGPEAALIRADQCVSERLKTFTQYIGQDLERDVQQEYASVNLARHRIAFFEDGTYRADTPDIRHAFVHPYFGDVLVDASYQGISSVFEKLRG